jgi:hypothetical protein
LLKKRIGDVHEAVQKPQELLELELELAVAVVL